MPYKVAATGRWDGDLGMEVRARDLTMDHEVFVKRRWRRVHELGSSPHHPGQVRILACAADSHVEKLLYLDPDETIRARRR